MRPTFFAKKMKAVAAILLVCIVNQNGKCIYSGSSCYFLVKEDAMKISKTAFRNSWRNANSISYISSAVSCAVRTVFSRVSIPKCCLFLSKEYDLVFMRQKRVFLEGIM